MTVFLCMYACSYVSMYYVCIKGAFVGVINEQLLLVSMAVKHNNVLLNLITGCLYWLTTCFGQLYDHHQVYKS